LRRHNQSWRCYRRLLIEENKWRAQRYGVGGDLADFGRRRLEPFAELVEQLVELVDDEAERLGCAPEVRRARDIVAGGTSADHQLRVYHDRLEAGAGKDEALVAVVDWLIETTRAGTVAP
jgi:carboxylate-amine ligase